MTTDLRGVHSDQKLCAIWNHKYDFRPIYHDVKLKSNFTSSILKSQYPISLIKDFLVFFIDSALSWCVKSYQGRLSFFYNLIGFFNQAFKSDWLMRLSKTFSLVGKRCDLEQKVVWFRIYRTNGAFSQIWQKISCCPCPLVTKSYWTYCWIFLHTFYVDICEKELPRNWSQVITVKIPKKIT